MLLSILLAFIAISLPYCLCHYCHAVIVIFVSYWHGGIETYRAQTMYIVMIAPYQILHHFVIIIVIVSNRMKTVRNGSLHEREFA